MRVTLARVKSSCQARLSRKLDLDETCRRYNKNNVFLLLCGGQAVVVKKLAKSFKRMAKASFAMLLITAWMAPVPAAAASYTVTEESDWYFEVTEDDTNVVIYGNSNSSCTQFVSDPFLWLYDLSGTVLASNDDGNHNNETQCVSSKIDTTLDAGVYRLHAGYCCSQRGNGYDGGEYSLVTDLTLATNFSTYNGVRFSYTPAYIEQTIDVSSYAGAQVYVG